MFFIHKKSLIEISAKIKHLCEKQNSVSVVGFGGNI